MAVLGADGEVWEVDRDGGERAELEHDDLAECGGVAGFVGVGEVVPDEFELAKVGGGRALAAEAFQGASLGAVVEDRFVALGELLVAVLPFADVVEEAVGGPAVVVAVAVSLGGVGEEQHDVGAGRGADAALLTTAIAGVDFAAGELITGRQARKHRS